MAQIKEKTKNSIVKTFKDVLLYIKSLYEKDENKKFILLSIKMNNDILNTKEIITYITPCKENGQYIKLFDHPTNFVI